MTQTAEDKNSKNSNSAPAQQAKQQIINRRPYDLMIVGLDTKDGPEHMLYDRRNDIPLDGDRIPGYVKYGVQKPIHTREMVVIDGRQRVRYARAVWDMQAKQGVPEDKRIMVPTIALSPKVDDATAWELSRQLNIHDKSGPVMTAWDMTRSLKINGGDYKKVAATYGVSEQTVRNFERMIVKLSPDVLKKVEDDELTATAAFELTAFTPDEQAAILDEIKQEGGSPDVANVKKKAAAKKGKQGQSPKDKLDRLDIHCHKWAKAVASGSATKEDLLKFADYVFGQVTGKTAAKLVAAAEKDAAAKKAKKD